MRESQIIRKFGCEGETECCATVLLIVCWPFEGCEGETECCATGPSIVCWPFEGCAGETECCATGPSIIVCWPFEAKNDYNLMQLYYRHA